MFEFLRFFLTLLIGIAVGWGACAWYNGLSVSSLAANTAAQNSVDAAVLASSSIESAERDTKASEARVQYITRTVEVDKTCPPGAGALSDDVAHRLRVAMAKASSPSDSATTGVRGESNKKVSTDQY